MASARPDGGWGWVVALSLFMTNIIVDGVKYSFGIMFIDLLDTFNSSNSVASWILSIQLGASLLSGPLIGGFVNRFGCRRVAMVGTILSFVGFIVSPFANSIYYLYISFGVVSGFGFSMMSLPGGVALVRYFDKRLAVASCISSMGTGIGTIVFSPIIKVLIDRYTWRGAMMVESAIVLNGLICAAVIRPVQKNNTVAKDLSVEMGNNNTESPMLAINHANVDETLLNEINDNVIDTRHNYQREVDTREDDILLKVCDKIRNDVDELTTPKCRQTLNDPIKQQRWISLSPLKDPGFMLFLIANLMLELGLYVPYTFLPDMMVRRGYQPQDAVWILFLMGVLGTVSRAGIGFIASIKCINRVKLCNSLIITSGVILIVCPFCASYDMFIAFGVTFGIISGSSNSLRYVLIPDLFGVDTIADCLGLNMLFAGVAALIGLPIAGAIFDISGSYTLPFIIAGTEIAICGVLIFLIPIVQTKTNAQ